METNPLATALPRRTLLVVAGASGMLAACGGSSDEETPAQPANTSSPGTTSPPPGPGGEVVATVADVPVGGGTINRELHLVVTQPSAGQFKGFTSICTHQGCDVSGVANNLITCGCHGSQFSSETGDVERGPARTPLTEVGIAVQGDSIVRA